MRDPFLIDSPTCISFSGGRTSAYMLYRVLEANGGLPDGVVVCFANTGLEDEATLRFVRDCSDNWEVPITWVEYRDEGYALVNFETASRNGEPFEALIRKRRYLPNPVTRFCTIELKIRAMARHLKALGMGETMAECENMSVIGIRADEQRRVAKIADRARMPLAQAGITVGDVDAFWGAQAWGLGLPNRNGRTTAGNCVLCFLKPAAQLASLIAEKPERAIWWARMEEVAATDFVAKTKGDGWRFRMDRPSYAAMAKNAAQQADAFGHDEEAIPCFCGD
jgi:3'-phosphoadenosine 5'-phosphosulfate sulfotransferase (PAPS reductase)/FAD synthetase